MNTESISWLFALTCLIATGCNSATEEPWASQQSTGVEESTVIEEPADTDSPAPTATSTPAESSTEPDAAPVPLETVSEHPTETIEAAVNSTASPDTSDKPTASHEDCVAAIKALGGRLMTVDDQGVPSKSGKALLLYDAPGFFAADLAHLKGVGNLKHVHLRSPKLTDAGLHHLKELKDLEVLSLNSTGFTDAALQQVRDMPRLRSLYLFNKYFTNAGLEHLEGTSNLKDISLGEGFSDPALGHLKDLSSLENLNLSGSGFTDAGLSLLSEMQNLQRLSLNGNGLTDAGLVHLSGLTQLKTLSLGSKQFTSAGLVHLKELTGLEELQLSYIVGAKNFGDDGLEHLKELKKLRRLGISSDSITDAGLKHLHKLTSLEELHLSGDSFSDAGKNKLQAALPECVMHVRRNQGGPPTSESSLRRIAMAMRNFHDAHQGFPASHSVAEEGKPLLSWRVHILPYLGEARLYSEFHLNEPWDSEHNRTLVSKMPAVYRSPHSKADPGKTVFLGNAISNGVLGDPTDVSTPPHGTKITGKPPTMITDGVASTILAIEANDSQATIWTKPRDFELNEGQSLEGIAGLHDGGFYAAWCDGSVQFVLNATSPEAIRALFTIDGAESVLTYMRRDLAEQSEVQKQAIAEMQKLDNIQLIQLKGAGESLDFSNPDITDSMLQFVQPLTGLQSLTLGPQITDAGLSHLKGLSELNMLNLANTQFTGAGFEHLVELKNLQGLNLSGSQVSDTGMESARQLSSLKMLDLSGTGITDVGMKSVGELTSLHSLILNDTQITETGLAHVAAMKQLSRLEFRGIQLTDAGLEHLKALRNLHGLNLKGMSITDSGLLHLSELSGLHRLDLSETKITDAGLEHLKGLENLYYIDLRGTQVTEPGKIKLKNALPNCYIVTAAVRRPAARPPVTRPASPPTRSRPPGNSVSRKTGTPSPTPVSREPVPGESAIDAIKRLGGTVKLNKAGDATSVGFARRIRDVDVKYLMELNSLEQLQLYNTQITDAALAYLNKLASLKQLYLSNSRITDEGLIHLTGMTNLTVLDLSGNRISDAGLKHLNGLTGLLVLGLSQTKITDNGLEYLADLENLKSIDLTGNRITADGLQHLQNLNQLESLQLSRTQITSDGLKYLKELGKLKTLHLDETRIGGAALQFLTDLRDLTILQLRKTSVDDAGLEHLKGLASLQYLFLDNTPVTDAGLAHLHGLESLQEINLRGTAATSDGVASLWRALPQCSVHSGFPYVIRRSERRQSRRQPIPGLKKLSVAELEEILVSTDDHSTTKAAAGRLWELDTSQTQQALIKGLGANRSATYHSAGALEQMSVPQAYSVLVEVFDSCRVRGWRDVAHHLARAVGSTGDSRASSFLTQQLNSRDDFYGHPYIRAGAAIGMAHLNDVRAVALLEDMLADDDPAAYGAIEGLGIIGRRTSIPVLKAGMQGEDTGRCYQALLAMRIPELCLELFQQASDDDQSRRAVIALGECGNAETDKHVIATLNKLQPEEQIGLLYPYVNAVTKAGGPRATSVLLELFDIASDSSISLLTGHLAASGDEAAAQAILDAVTNAGGSSQRGRSLLLALSRSATANARNIVAQLSDSRDEQLAASADMILKTSLHPSMIEESEDNQEQISVLVEDLQATEWKARYRAAVKLGRTGQTHNPESITALIRLLGDEMSTVRWAAIRALERPQAATEAQLQKSLDESNPQIRGWAAILLTRSAGDSDATRQQLMEALTSEDWDLRFAAIEALTRVGVEAVPSLKPLAEDGNEWVRYGARRALSQLGEEGLTALREQQRSSETAQRNGSTNASSVSDDAEDSVPTESQSAAGSRNDKPEHSTPALENARARVANFLRPLNFRKAALARSGDADSGRQLFLQDERLTCRRCHQVDGSGGETGPDLTHVGSRLDRTHLIEAILQPSQVIADEFRQYKFLTAAGHLVSGIAEDRNGDSIRLTGRDAAPVSVSQDDIVNEFASPFSVMPPNLADALSEEEFTDLVAWLESLRSESKDSAAAETATDLDAEASAEPHPWKDPVAFVLHVAKQSSDPAKRVFSMTGLAQAQITAGQNEAALQTIQLMLDTNEDVRDTYRATNNIAFCGVLQHRAGSIKLASPALDRAWELSHSIRPDVRRVTSLTQIAQRWIDIENRSSAMKLLDEALSLVDSIPASRSKSSALARLALQLARAEDPDRAVDTAGKIDSETARSKALKEVCTELSKAGSAEDAIRIAKDMQEEKEGAAETLEELIKSSAWAGNKDGVSLLLTRVEAPDRRTALIQECAVAFATGGQLATGLSYIEELEGDKLRDATLKRIVSTLRRNNDVDQAVSVAESIHEESERKAALMNIPNLFYQQNRDLPAAVAIVEKYKEPETQLAAWSALAASVIRHSDHNPDAVQQAVDLIERMDNPVQRDYKLGGIMADAIQRGHVEEGFRIADRIQSTSVQTVSLMSAADRGVTSANRMSPRQILLRAVDCADKIESDNDRGRALQHLSRQLSQLGFHEEARVVSELLTTAEAREEVLSTRPPQQPPATTPLAEAIRLTKSGSVASGLLVFRRFLTQRSVTRHT